MPSVRLRWAALFIGVAMQFKNLSVAKKIWLLMLVVMGAMLATGLSMTGYMNQLEAKLRADIQDMDERIRVVVELRGTIETAASFLIASNMAQDADSMAFFQSKFKETSARTESLIQDTGSRLVTPEGKALFERIQQKRADLNVVAEKISTERRNDGDVVAMVRAELLPAVQGFMDDMNTLVGLQEKLLSNAMVQSENSRSSAMMLGGLVLALVVIAGLLLSAWLIRQMTLPLVQAVELANSIASGDLTRDVHDDRKDELGQLLRSLNAMAAKLREVVGEVRSGVESVSAAAG